ncbi:MAG: TIGR04255 family protein [Rhodospirillaceae bacterium]|nr:TIGR04255 family protein [Rhodospirillaceae bacterium]
MKAEPTPLATGIPTEVPLPEAPLVRVIAQVRFPPILSIRKEDSVADFQEELRASYPHLQRNEVRNIDIRPGQDPSVSEAVIWRLADRQEPATWRVSLGVDFVALEAWKYSSRQDFLNRLRRVLASVEACFQPAEALRVGLRYIDRLEGEAMDRIGDLIQGNFLGILQPGIGQFEPLREATVHSMTQVQLQAAEGMIQGRWGNMPPNATYDPETLQPTGKPSWVLDLDMFSPQASPFRSEELAAMTGTFAERIYSVFRMMVTDQFLKFYGGTP